MELFLFKLTATPLVMAIATWLSRRFGVGVGGWLAGLPLTSGPVSVFLALQHAPQFAADAALGTMSGSASASIFCVVYAFASRRFRWAPSLALGLLGFLGMTLIWKQLSLPLVPLYIVILGMILAALGITPRATGPQVALAPPRWDMPLRIVLATGFVLALTAASETLGATWSGLISPIPIYASLMTAFAHAQLGPDGALRVLRGVLLGAFAFATFFLIVGATVTLLPLWLSYTIASLAAVLINGALFNRAR